MRSPRITLAAALGLAAAALLACSSSGGGVKVTLQASSVRFGAKAAPIAAAFSCSGSTPYRGALVGTVADAVTCTGRSGTVLLVATFADSTTYQAAIAAVTQHDVQRKQGSAIAQGGTFLVTVDVDARQPGGSTFTQQSAAVQAASDKLGISFGSSGPPG